MEITFVIIKHDAIQRGLVGKIITRFEDRGFQVVANKMIALTKEKAEIHYDALKDHPFYSTIISRFTSGPGQALVLVGKNAVRVVRKMIGSTNPQDAELGTIRGDFGLSVERNIIHASDSQENAVHEIGIWLKSEDIIGWNKDDVSWANYNENKTNGVIDVINTQYLIDEMIRKIKETLLKLESKSN